MFFRIRISALLLAAFITACMSHHAAKTPQTPPPPPPPAMTYQQHDTAAVKPPYNINLHYHPSYTVTHDIVHTSMAVRFDWQHQWMYGREALTLHDHFYPTDTVVLDAKGMTIERLGIINGKDTMPLTYIYKDSAHVHIKLNRVYTDKENFTLYFQYISKPEDRASHGSAAIADDKGLYFINPLKTEAGKPQEIWTQGETESNSVWMITVDKPNMKSTHEIAITIDSAFTTLSNGLMISQKLNKDGTRTDIWKMDKPIAPYLFMMAIGPFAITHDKWHGMDVNYYTERNYAADARAIFGNTPEMIDYYSRVLQYPYAWQKYSQVVARDYVSGAMENATATLHGEFIQQHKRELLDDDHEEVICHELFHHWFGDLVTCESWSNLTLNESFANYGEVLWLGYKYGTDEGDYINDRDMKTAINAVQQHDPNLVRFTYNDREDMFDGITYNKGGRILHMLRHVVGDSAFFKSLSLYLHQNEFKAAEAQQLRLAFEQVTGQDLNWFFNQWYYNNGYPRLTITYIYDDAHNKSGVIIAQKPNSADNKTIWRLPMAVDVYVNNAPTRYNIVFQKPVDTFYFATAAHPALINVDAEKVILCEKTDYKTDDQWIYQYYHAPLYKDRAEALDYANIVQADNAAVRKMLVDALHDKYWRLRVKAISIVDVDQQDVRSSIKTALMDIAVNDPKSSVRAMAISKLAKYNDPALNDMFARAFADSSYAVESAALNALYNSDKPAGYQKAKTLQNTQSVKIQTTLDRIFVEQGDSTQNSYFMNQLTGHSGREIYGLLSIYGDYLGRMPMATIQPSLTTLYDIAKHNNVWYIRAVAMRAIDATSKGIQTQISTLGSNPKADKLSALAKDIDTQTDAIKNAETNPTLRRIWGK